MYFVFGRGYFAYLLYSAITDKSVIIPVKVLGSYLFLYKGYITP